MRPGTVYQVIFRKMTSRFARPIRIVDAVRATFRTQGPAPVDLPRSHYQAQIDSLLSAYSPRITRYSYDNVRVDLGEMRDILQPVGSYTRALISASSTDGAHSFTDLAVPAGSSREMTLTNLQPGKEYDLTVKNGHQAR